MKVKCRHCKKYLYIKPYRFLLKNEFICEHCNSTNNYCDLLFLKLFSTLYITFIYITSSLLAWELTGKSNMIIFAVLTLVIAFGILLITHIPFFKLIFYIRNKDIIE